MIKFEELKEIVLEKTGRELTLDVLVQVIVKETEQDTFESVLERMLARVPNDLDKREGSLIYDALAPFAAELQILNIKAEYNRKESFADTASRERLIMRAKEHGRRPLLATKAVVKAEIAPAGIDIANKRFSLDGVVFKATGKVDETHFKLECETAGSAGNKSSGDLIPIEYINGLEKITITELLIPARDDEDTEVFREKYFSSFDSQAWGGNIQDYKEKTKALNGVGGVKVTPVWNGEGTVKLTILSSTYDVPGAELLTQLKQTIDPAEKTGLGYGMAGIDHRVTVEGVEKVLVNVQTTISYQPGWNYEASKTYIEKAIDGYLLELAKAWESEGDNGLVVRVSRLETALLNAQGVLDVQGTRLNGQASNLVLSKMQIPKRGTFNG